MYLLVHFLQHLVTFTACYDKECYGLELSKKGWKNLLKVFCNRYVNMYVLYNFVFIMLHFIFSHKDASNHGCILTFLKSVSDWYLWKYKPDHFFLDLLSLEVPNLFYKNDRDLETSESVRSQFYDFLDKYYRGLQKQCSISDNMPQILVSSKYWYTCVHSLSVNCCVVSSITRWCMHVFF